MTKTKKIALWVVGAIAGLLLICVLALGLLFRQELKTIGSIEKVSDDAPYYVMD